MTNVYFSDLVVQMDHDKKYFFESDMAVGVWRKPLCLLIESGRQRTDVFHLIIWRDFASFKSRESWFAATTQITAICIDKLNMFAKYALKKSNHKKYAHL